MDDEQIVALYFARDERAIEQTKKKYDRYCRYIAENILPSYEDVEECVSDAYLKAWNTIPPQHPDSLAGYMGMLTRQISFDRYRGSHRLKRGGGEMALILDELEDCIEDKSSSSVEDKVVLQDALNRFFTALPQRVRIVFLQRYWYMCTIEQIADETGLSPGNVKVMLHRTRRSFKDYLEKEGIDI